MKNDFYTYAYLRRDGTPYYIGKGRGKRCYYNGGRSVSAPPKDRILLLKTGLTEREAFRHEVYMIKVFGRKDIGTGILRNLTDGGDGTTGFVPTKETRKKLSEAGKGNTKRKGVPHSPEAKVKLREASLGRRHSEEVKEKIRQTQIGKVVSEQTREKLRQAHLGKVVSEQTKEKMRGRSPSEETRRKVSQKMRSYKWFHDPEKTEEGRFILGSQPENWVPGRKVNPGLNFHANKRDG
jgi:hypothetical protein